jgi:tetratricopeptide (TPR) repeat protein
MTRPSLLLPALLLAACTTRTLLEESRNYSRLGEHARAFQVLDAYRDDRLRAGDPIDPEFEREYAATRQRFLVDRGRSRIFEDREDEAFVDLAAVLALDPDHAEAKALRERAIVKKAARATSRGTECLAKNELQQALVYFVDAETWIPGHPPAAEGAQKVRDAVARLEVRAQQQFLEAVRKLPEFRYYEARWHASNSVRNDPARNDATQLRSKADRELAQIAWTRGLEAQKKDRYGAAMIDYRQAKRLAPDLPGVDAAIAEMQAEIAANTAADKAVLLVRKGRFAEGRAILEAAFAASKYSRPYLSELMLEADRIERERQYTLCRDLEILGKKAEALAAFEALQARWPAGVRDEKARIEALRVDVEGAASEYAAGEAAEAAQQWQEALDHYRQAERFYPGYQHAKARMQALRERLAGAAGS